MGFILPGFPEHGEPIDMPDIGELMCYPAFSNADIDSVYKNGTDFQRYLLDKIKFRHDSNHITVYSAVHLVHAHVRPITFYGAKDPMDEWHIDALGEYDYQRIKERVHLMISHAEARTEFLVNPMDFSYLPPSIPRKEFHSLVRDIMRTNPVETRMIDENIFYVFTNHLHRPTAPKRVQLRYTLRVRETNRPEPPSVGEEGMPELVTANKLGAIPTPNTERGDGFVKVFFPDSSLFQKGGD